MNVPIGPTIPGSQNLKTSSVDILHVNDVLTITGNGTSNVGLEIIDKHIKTKQTVSPTISSGTLTNATDVAGTVSFLSTGLAGVQTTVTFDSEYETAPVILLTPKNINGAVNAIGYYVTSTVSGFVISAAYTTSSIPYEFYYTVIQSN
jgi:hypothetical protein